MSCTCLISSSLYEIEMFKKMYTNIECIISDIEGYIQPVYDSINTAFEVSDLCIIGETINYSDEFIAKLICLGEKHCIEIINYHISDPSKSVMQKINAPVVFISSLLPDMGKAVIGLRIAQALNKLNYKPLLISSNPIWKMFDYITFPFDIVIGENPILELNKFIIKKSSEDNYDIVILCVPGGIISSPKYNMYCDYGLLNYIISHAVSPFYILNCIHQNTANLGLIPEPFLPYKINRHLRTDKILDQNRYDQYEKKLNLTITKEMAENDQELNIFQPMVYDLIAKEIDHLINKEVKNDKRK